MDNDKQVQAIMKQATTTYRYFCKERNQWTSELKDIAYYNSNGKCDRQVFYDQDGGVKLQRKMFYGGGDKVICYKEILKDTVIETTCKYIGDLLVEKVTCENGNEISKTCYEFDQDKNVIREVEYVSDILTLSKSCSYVAGVLRHVEVLRNDEGGEFDSMNVEFYNDGVIVESYYFSFEISKHSRDVYTYYSDGEYDVEQVLEYDVYGKVVSKRIDLDSESKDAYKHYELNSAGELFLSSETICDRVTNISENMMYDADGTVHHKDVTSFFRDEYGNVVREENVLVISDGELVIEQPDVYWTEIEYY